MNPNKKNSESEQGAEIGIELRVYLDRVNRERINVIQARARIDKPAQKKLKKKIEKLHKSFLKLRDRITKPFKQPNKEDKNEIT